MMRITPVSHDDVMHLAPAAAPLLIRIRANVPTWALSTDEGAVVGCAQVWRVGAARWRLDGCYIQPAHRGRGCGLLLVAARIAWAASNHPSATLDTFAYRPCLFFRPGWRLRCSYKIGTHWMESRPCPPPTLPHAAQKEANP